MIKSGRMRWGKHEAHMGETINAYKVLVGNLKEMDHKKDLGVDGNHILKWTINRGDGVDWIHLAQDRDLSRFLEDTVMKFSVPKDAVKFLTSRATLFRSVSQLFTSLKFQNSLTSPLPKPATDIDL
jgi:hypothetical protein